MDRVSNLFLLAIGATGLAVAQPLSINLPNLGDAWLPGGSPEATLSIPKDSVPEIQVRLSPPWSERILPGDVELKLDGHYPRPTRSTGGEGHLFVIRTQDVRGLLPNVEHYLEVSTPNSKVRSLWTIVHWDKAYAQASAVAADGIPVGVRVDQPPGGVVLLGGNSATVHFVGEVQAGLEAQLIIDGRSVTRVSSKPGFQFDTQLPVPSDVKDVVVTAKEGGSITTLVLPVRTIQR